MYQQQQPQPQYGQQPQFGAQMSMGMGAPNNGMGMGMNTGFGGQPDPAFAAFNMAAGASMGVMGMMAQAAANQPQPTYGAPSSGPSPSPYGGMQSPTGGPSSPYGGPPQPQSQAQGGTASVSMNMGGAPMNGPGMGMGGPPGMAPGMGMNMSVSASGMPPPSGATYGSPTGAPSPTSPYGAPPPSLSSSGPYGQPPQPQPQDGTASISMNIGGPGMGGPPGMGMNMSVTASGMPPPSGPSPSPSPYGGPTGASPTGQPIGPYGQPSPSSGAPSPYGQPPQPQSPPVGTASISMNMGGPPMGPPGTMPGMGMGINMSINVPAGPPPGPQERDVIEQMFNISSQIQMNAKTNLARIRDLITQTSLPGGGVAPTGSMSIGGMPMGAAVGVSIGGFEPGMIDPKTNPKFPLNVRKNCREAEPKWIEKVAEIKNHLGRDIQLVCNWEHWYNHEKMDTHKKDNLGSTIYETYMCAWAEGFIKFSKDVDNLDAFRMALTVPIIHIKLGWDKSIVAKQKGGYIQQYFADGRLYIQVNPGYLGSGLYELSDGDYIANAL